ncbi:hypothetical protein TWF718_007670 [Orbilia javanica]|uniref:Uncharacterized protein n=1 Tax=Orbilia javanica TaxID=47235 RepID=A0AAN8RNQ7_9PEZI
MSSFHSHFGNTADSISARGRGHMAPAWAQNPDSIFDWRKFQQADSGHALGITAERGKGCKINENGFSIMTMDQGFPPPSSRNPGVVPIFSHENRIRPGPKSTKKLGS